MKLIDSVIETRTNETYLTTDEFKILSENERLKRRIAALETRLAATRKLLTQALDSTNEY